MHAHVCVCFETVYLCRLGWPKVYYVAQDVYKLASVLSHNLLSSKITSLHSCSLHSCVQPSNALVYSLFMPGSPKATLFRFCVLIGRHNNLSRICRYTIALDFSCADDFWKRKNIIVQSHWISVSIHSVQRGWDSAVLCGRTVKMKMVFIVILLFQTVIWMIKESLLFVLKTGNAWVCGLCFNHF